MSAPWLLGLVMRGAYGGLLDVVWFGLRAQQAALWFVAHFTLEHS